MEKTIKKKNVLELKLPNHNMVKKCIRKYSVSNQQNSNLNLWQILYKNMLNIGIYI